MSESDKLDIANKVVDILIGKGFEITKASDLDAELQLKKAKARMMRRNRLTPYEISKFELINGVKSIKTVKNMVVDGRIRPDENYKDSSGKLYITRAAIERLNNG